MERESAGFDTELGTMKYPPKFITAVNQDTLTVKITLWWWLNHAIKVCDKIIAVDVYIILYVCLEFHGPYHATNTSHHETLHANYL